MIHRTCLARCVALLVLLCTVGQASLQPLPLDDDSAFGREPLRSGYLSTDEYQDASLHVLLERFNFEGTDCLMATIKVADASQIRTTKSSRSFTDKEMVGAALMAKKARAVFGVNGDFFKHVSHGYTIRQQHVVRKRLMLQGAQKYDVLFIDDAGDFSAVRLATTESAQAHEDALAQAGRQVVNTFTFGPVLVEDGEVQPFDKQLWQGIYPMQRVAIAQTGPLSYAVFQCGGATQLKTGLTMEQFARMIVEKQPGTRLAYNLDGGGSASLVFDNVKINTNLDVREICDMIYFATIVTGEGAGHE